MTCAEEIEQVLRKSSRPMRADEIAAEINRRGLYVRGDGAPLPPYQVSSIAHGARARFNIDDGLIGLGEQPAGSEMAPSEEPPAVAVLIGCVSRKQSTMRPAKDLYRTELFRRRRAYAEASGLPWYIVSAQHALLDPERVIEPYDLRVTDLDRAGREALSERIAAALEERFGALGGRVLEVHAGQEYVQMLGIGLRPRGAKLRNPLEGLRIGEQLAWYARHAPTAPSLPPQEPSAAAPPSSPRTAAPASHGLAHAITTAFMAGAIDLSARPDAPAAGWAGMPEVVAASRLKEVGASEKELRLLCTFTAAMDRARDADRLWRNAAALFEEEPWVFEPTVVVDHGLTELTDVLRNAGLTQRHGSDAAAWRRIAEALAEPDVAPAIHTAVFEGRGDARELLRTLSAESRGGTPLFPMLRGPKIGPMWVRMLAYPGQARISSLDVLPVAVDVQVRKVTEHLDVTDTSGLDLEQARPIIQAAWRADVEANGAAGPEPLEGTAAALDPALWFYGKWGCTRCERAGERIPVAEPCDGCVFARAQ